MGGSPSERKMSNPTNKEKSQRYLQNKKGRTSFFLYHRNVPPRTATVLPLPAHSPPPHMTVPRHAKLATREATVATTSGPPLLLEMEVASSSSDSEESCDGNTTPDNTAICSSVSRRRKHHAATVAMTFSTSNTAVTVVEPHVATRVQFANVEIRSYAITIGDHPCCTIGCPITLDWEFTQQDTVSLVDYETQKYGHDSAAANHTTKMNDLRISPEERVELLLHQPSSQMLSELEIRRASRKFHRNKSCSLRQCERIHETFFHHHPQDHHMTDNYCSDEQNSSDDDSDHQDAVGVVVDNDAK